MRRREKRRRNLWYQRRNGCHQRGYDGEIMTIFGLMEESRKMQFKPRPSGRSGRRELARCVVAAAVVVFVVVFVALIVLVFGLRPRRGR